MAKKRYYESRDLYAGEQSRRTMEMQDAGMIKEDPSAVANLPQGVIMRPYARNGNYLPEMLDDTIRGIDKQINLDDSQRSKNFMPKKV